MIIVQPIRPSIIQPSGHRSAIQPSFGHSANIQPSKPCRHPPTPPQAKEQPPAKTPPRPRQATTTRLPSRGGPMRRVELGVAGQRRTSPARCAPAEGDTSFFSGTGTTSWQEAGPVTLSPGRLATRTKCQSRDTHTHRSGQGYQIVMPQVASSVQGIAQTRTGRRLAGGGAGEGGGRRGGRGSWTLDQASFAEPTGPEKSGRSLKGTTTPGFGGMRFVCHATARGPHKLSVPDRRQPREGKSLPEATFLPEASSTTREPRRAHPTVRAEDG